MKPHLHTFGDTRDDDNTRLADRRLDAGWVSCYHTYMPARPARRFADVLALVIALVGPLGVAALGVPFRRSVPNAAEALALVVVVVAIAASGRRVAGLVAAVSAAVWFDFFLTQPYEHFTINHRADIEITVLLLVVGTAVTEIAVRGRRGRLEATTDAAYLAAIAATTDLVASGESPVAVIDQVRVQLAALLGLRDCTFDRSRLGGLPVLNADGRLLWGETEWDIDRLGVPRSPIELRATCAERVYGRFVLDPRPGTTPSSLARQVAVILANQVGAALAHEVAGAPRPAASLRES